jgi:sulfotransferase family protein
MLAVSLASELRSMGGRMGASKLGAFGSRGMWTLDRFGASPRKVPARVLNRREPKVLSVSIPKSGTLLVEWALCLHPRLYRRILPTVKSTDLQRWVNLDHLLCRLRPGQVVVAHLPYEPGYRETIARRGASALFLIRDPRDVVVSEAHYVASTPSHRAHEVFARQPTLRDAHLLVIRGDK